MQPGTRGRPRAGPATGAMPSWPNLSGPVAGRSRPLQLPALHQHTLPNGLTVVVAPRPGLPLVSLTLATLSYSQL